MSWVEVVGFVAVVLAAYWAGHKDGEDSRSGLPKENAEPEDL